MALTVTLVVLAALVAVLVHLLGVSHRDAADDVRIGAARAARAEALNLATIDYRTARADLRRILDGATGKLRAQFAEQQPHFADVMRRDKSVSKGDILAVGVVPGFTSARAQVVVAADATVTTLTAGGQHQTHHPFGREPMTSAVGSAQADLQKFAAANRGMTVDSTSTDSRVVLLLDRVKQWQAKVVEARDNLSLAQYTSSASARLMEIGTSVVTAPELATTSLAGDGSSAKFAALVLALGLALGLAYLVALTWVDKTARDPRALEHRLGVPVVATIPKLVSSRGF